jgi:uncharacterized protein YjiS (DUF1127 family)
MSQIRKSDFTHSGARANLLDHIGAGVRRVMDRWLAQRMAASFERLDDAVLRDIGITRAEIPAVARRVTARSNASAAKRNSVQTAGRQEVTT